MATFKSKSLLTLCCAVLLTGCNTVVMNPAGDIAHQQSHLLLISTLLMLIIIIPVISMTIWFAWKYRKNNAKAIYEPDWDHSTRLEILIWGAPLLIIIALGTLTWINTHNLDPYRPLSRLYKNHPIPINAKTLEVEVVSLDWKWLFIYPQQGIATVNELAAPINVPIHFNLTSSATMNSFFIPTLAGQIYTMPSMQTSLNAVINQPGKYNGFSANYSGSGFSEMNFKFYGMTGDAFNNWVKKIQNTDHKLDRVGYLKLERPSIKEPVSYYGSVEANLYHDILNRCIASAVDERN